MEEEVLAAATPRKTDVLLISVVHGAGGVVAVEGLRATEGVTEG
jgi:hypothetical protein